MSLIYDNIGTIIITLLLVAIVYIAIRSIINDKKKGRGTCGGNCASCGHCTGAEDMNGKRFFGH